MKDSIRQKLEKVVERHEELSALMADPGVISDQTRFRELSQEYAQLEPVVAACREHRTLSDELQAAREMLDDGEAEVRAMAEAEIERLREALDAGEDRLTRLLLPRDPNDDSNTYLEIRAGTGGDEAALFAGDLFRMYTRYAERQGWRIEVLTESEGEHGGFKEIISRVVGDRVYSHLKFESGAHRVQRVPATESGGRIHTSACTVAVMPEADEIGEIEVNPADLRVDTFRASGAGGQHVNKTDSAIRLTHLPTGIVVECQDERSQHKNRARAMSLLKARLVSDEQERQTREETQARRRLVGSGDRSERIRTYNFPQGRVTDHRINLTLYKLDEILQGNLDEIIDTLVQEYQADQLAELAEQG